VFGAQKYSYTPNTQQLSEGKAQKGDTIKGRTLASKLGFWPVLIYGITALVGAKFKLWTRNP